MAAIITLNNGKSLYDIEEAYKKIMALTQEINNYDNIAYIINQELYYVLKYKRKNNITKDMVLLEFIKKFKKDLYIKTPEIKKIIGFLSYDSTSSTTKENNTWFFKNLELGYTPTPAVLTSLFEIVSPESKLKLYELFPTKIDSKDIFNFEFLIKTIFITSDVNKIDDEFKKFKIIDSDITNIITNNGLNIFKSYNNSPDYQGMNIRNYIYNLLNYMIHKNIKLNVTHIISLIDYNSFTNSIKTPTDFQKDVLNRISTIIDKFSNDDLKKVFYNILASSLYIKNNLNFVKTYCTYDKYTEKNIHDLIKDSTFQNFPFEMFFNFYSGIIDKKICNLLFLTRHHTFIRNIIRVITDEYEIYLKENNNNPKINDDEDDFSDDYIESDTDLDDTDLDDIELDGIPHSQKQQIAQKAVNEIIKNSINKNKELKKVAENKDNKEDILNLKSFKNSIKVSLMEIFELSFEYGSIPTLDYFLNNKYVITEDMVLNNFSRELISILLTSSKKGFYVTEKCFDHILLNMFMNNMCYDHKKIQQISIYVNDDEDFSKFTIQLKEKWDSFQTLSTKVLDDIKTTIDYLNDKKVTNEMLILCNSKLVRAYLLRRMDQEKIQNQNNIIQETKPITQDKQEPVKKVKKIIVKKIVKVKKSSDNI